MKYNVKMACIFHLILVSILYFLTLSVKNRGWFFFLLNRQNPLSMTEVICRQSLKTLIKLVLISSELKFNSESSNFKVEVLRTRFPCQGLLDFLRILFFFKKNLNYGRSMGSDAIVLNLSKKLDSTDCSM